jgi:nucleoside-diphosphate-sugar epimerase
MRIVITGNMGYVGPVLARFFCRNLPDSQLIGYDSGFFGHCLVNGAVLPEVLFDLQYLGDMRDISKDVMVGADAVVHLAAVSNDPMGNKFERATEEINHGATVHVAELAREAGVKNFVFASSCSIYGLMNGASCSESGPLNPLTAYARSKAEAEQALQQMDLDGMTVTSLRFATACGMSDRLRLDLVLNDFVACAVTSGEITVLSDGTPWRPLIDVEDMARAILWALQRSPSDGGEFLALNVGRDEWNFQIKDLAEAVADAVPGTRVSINTAAPSDTRSYQVDFSLFGRLAPGHTPRLSLDETIGRLRDGLTAIGFADKDFRNSSYVRLKTIERHIAAKRLGPELRWITRH